MSLFLLGTRNKDIKLFSKNRVEFSRCQKYSEVTTAVQHLFYISFHRTYLIIMERGNWYGTQKIIV